ncbi:ATP-dependent phosphoenolpyruvate carboxykinase [Pantoea coffeiphila]|nr:ATP-dependent phosphoenolpyruvate carboxykinase [Pantoea coffeiphila]
MSTGAVVVDTGIFTGRSPKDKCIATTVSSGATAMHHSG